MDYANVAKNVLESVGGESNVVKVVHCATRLRFNLKNLNAADKEGLESVSGVKGTVIQGGQFQVIIGNEVSNVYGELMKLLGPTMETDSEDENNEVAEKKGNWGSRLISTLTEIFAPALPAITGAGMFKAILAAIIAFHLMDTEGQTYKILYAMSDAVFYFLPMIIGYTSAKKFGGKPSLVLATAGLLLYPEFMTLLAGESAVTFFIIPVTKFTYSCSVIPIILIALLESKVEKIAYQYVPSAVRYFVAPLLVIFICGVAGILVLGPIGGWIGDILAIGVQWLVENARIPGSFIIGATGPFVTMTGIHQSFTPITIQMFVQYGYDPLMFPGMLAMNMAQCGMALAVGLREKNKERKSMALSSSLTALMGITEPALFGVMIKSKRNMIAAFIGGGVGAVVAAILQLKAFAISGPGLASIAMFLGGDEPVHNLISAIIVMIVSIAVSFAVTMILSKNDKEVEA